MKTAAQIFAIELGRAAKASRSLLAGLTRDDRDDALAAAMLQCWETRDARGETPVDEWFAQALSVAVRHIKRASRSRHYADMKMDEIDSTSRSAEAQIEAEQLAKRLTRTEQDVASRLAHGYSLTHIAASLSMPHSELKKVMRKLRRLSDMNNTKQNPFNQRPPYAPGIENDYRDSQPAPIDHAIEAMLRRPKSERADCPVCWKCSYFKGMTPKHYHPPQLVEPEIREAVTAIEARKIQIGSRGRL